MLDIFFRFLFILEKRKERLTMTQDQLASRYLRLWPDRLQHRSLHATSSAPAKPTPSKCHLLREILSAQDRQNELLEELVSHLSGSQKQRANELGQWKQANPHLAKALPAAAEALGKVQTEFLSSLTQEINDNFEVLLDGEFMLNEFVDRFGPRLAHLNGLLQVLSQLSSATNAANASN